MSEKQKRSKQYELVHKLKEEMGAESVLKCYSCNGIVLNTCIGQTASNKLEQYADACKAIKSHHKKWNSFRFPASGERDEAKIKMYEDRIKGFIKSARTAKADAKSFSTIDPRTRECIEHMKEVSR